MEVLFLKMKLNLHQHKTSSTSKSYLKTFSPTISCWCRRSIATVSDTKLKKHKKGKQREEKSKEEEEEEVDCWKGRRHSRLLMNKTHQSRQKPRVIYFVCTGTLLCLQEDDDFSVGEFLTADGAVKGDRCIKFSHKSPRNDDIKNT
jgi:hypothetical protein